LSIPLEWQDAVIRSAITLKLSPVRGQRRDHRGNDHLSIPLEWQDAVIRSAITLKLSPVRGQRRDHRG
ncbi:hypothetical protein C7E25_25370, partial [Stenotrophomonas maltophilia]